MLDDVKELFVFKSLLTMPSDVLPLHLKETFPPIIWIFTEGDRIKIRLLFKVFSTLTNIFLIRDVIDLKSVTLGGYEGILVYLLPIWPKQFTESNKKIVLMEIEICYLEINHSYKWGNLGKRRGKNWSFGPKLIWCWSRNYRTRAIITLSWILTIHKGRILWGKILKKTFLPFKNG